MWTAPQRTRMPTPPGMRNPAWTRRCTSPRRAVLKLTGPGSTSRVGRIRNTTIMREQSDWCLLLATLRELHRVAAATLHGLRQGMDTEIHDHPSAATCATLLRTPCCTLAHCSLATSITLWAPFSLRQQRF